MNQRKVTFYSFIYRGLSAVLTFVNSVIVARYLTDKGDRGDYQLSATYATSGQRFSGGFANYFSRSLPRRPEDRVQIVQMGNFIMFLFSIVVWIVAACIGWFGHPSEIVMFALVGMPFTFLFGYASRLLNALGEISWLNRANISQAVVFLCVYLGFIAFNRHLTATDRLIWTYRIWLTSWFIAVATTLFVLYHKLRFGETLKWKWSKHEWRGFLSFGTWSSLALLSGYVNYRIDFWMLGWLTGDDALLSTYGIAITAAEILNTLTQSISSVVFHRVSAASANEAGEITEHATRQTLITSAGLACVLAALMPLLIILYGKAKYGAAVGPFYILLPGLILKAATIVIAQYFTNSRGKPLTLLWVNIIVICCNALICVFMIPLLGMYGAGISSTLAYLLELATYVFWYNRVSGRRGRDLIRLRTSDLRPYLEVGEIVRRRIGRGK